MTERYARSLYRLAVALAGVALVCSPAVFAQQTSTGTDHASISISMVAVMAPQVSLKLAVTELVFDLRGGTPQTTPQCVIGPSVTDIELPSVGLTKPLVAVAGILYSASPEAFTVTGTPVTPGEVALGNARQVCFHSFRLEAFSNARGWVLSVDRVAESGTEPIHTLYIGAACGAESNAGFSALTEFDSTTLASSGSATECNNLLVLVGLKPSLETSGTSATRLRYSIIAPMDGYGTTQFP